MSGIKFDECRLNAAIIHPSRVPEGDTIIIGDYATSANPTSDFSGFAAGRIVQENNHSHLYLLDGMMDRWDSRELVYHAVAFAKRYPPRVLMLERLGLSQLLEDAILAEAKRRDVSFGIQWIQISNKKAAKDFRVYEFQKLLDGGRVHFAAKDFINSAFQQLTRYAGGKANKGRHDDMADIFGYFALLLTGQL
jgi:hypothetical protein